MVAINMYRMLQLAAIVLLSQAASVADEQCHEGPAERIQPGVGACKELYLDTDVVAAVPTDFFKKYNADYGTPQDKLPICKRFLNATNEANGKTVPRARIVDAFDTHDYIVMFPSAPMAMLSDHGEVVNQIDKVKWCLI